MNNYWRRNGSRYFIAKEGKEFRRLVLLEANSAGAPRWLQGRLSIAVDLYPPDRRRRDVDNVLKAINDALQECGVYEDDSQIDRLTIVRREVSKPGYCTVLVEEI